MHRVLFSPGGGDPHIPDSSLPRTMLLLSVLFLKKIKCYTFAGTKLKECRSPQTKRWVRVVASRIGAVVPPGNDQMEEEGNVKGE